MKIRDLFTGYRVQIHPDADEWIVTLLHMEFESLTYRYDQLPAAVDAAHEWLLLLADETDLGDISASEVQEFLRNRLQASLVRQLEGDTGEHQAGRDDSLRHWLQGEMGWGE